MTIITNPRSKRVQAVFLKGHCQLISKGMQPPRGVRKTDVLRKAGEITKKIYKRGDFATAAADLKNWLEENPREI